MNLTITLSTDDGQEVTSLVSPVRDADYFLLSSAELCRRHIAPYIENLHVEGVLGLAVSVASQGLARIKRDWVV